MNELEHELLGFFEQAAARDVLLISLLKQDSRFVLTEERWCFTLPDLFAFLGQRFDNVRNASFSCFRRAIYNSPVNKAVRRFNAQIVIDTNSGHTDKSVYAMIWTPIDNHDGIDRS